MVIIKYISNRSLIIQGGMDLPLVIEFDVVEQIGFDFVRVLEVLPEDDFNFSCAKHF